MRAVEGAALARQGAAHAAPLPAAVLTAAAPAHPPAVTDRPTDRPTGVAAEAGALLPVTGKLEYVRLYIFNCEAYHGSQRKPIHGSVRNIFPQLLHFLLGPLAHLIFSRRYPSFFCTGTDGRLVAGRQDNVIPSSTVRFFPTPDPSEVVCVGSMIPLPDHGVCCSSGLGRLKPIRYLISVFCFPGVRRQ